MRRSQDGIARATEMVGPLLIRNNEQEIWAVGSHQLSVLALGIILLFIQSIK